MSHRFPPRTSAFSLIELVLALGIISFALVGIIGLFPVALNTAAASQLETHAALIARSIFNDLTSRPGDRTALLRQPSLKDAADSIDVNLGTAGDFFLAFDRDGAALADLLTQSLFESGTPAGSDGLFLVKVVVTPAGPGPITDPDALPAGLSRVDVTVTAPAPASLANRTRHTFTSLLRQQ